ncbi:MAG: hypothetical protein ACR2LE_01135 [Nocardioidaceae bacterium]
MSRRQRIFRVALLNLRGAGADPGITLFAAGDLLAAGGGGSRSGVEHVGR